MISFPNNPIIQMPTLFANTILICQVSLNKKIKDCATSNSDQQSRRWLDKLKTVGLRFRLIWEMIFLTLKV